MRWPAWRRRGEPPRAAPSARADVRRRAPLPDRSVLGWWFAGGTYAGSIDPTPGLVQKERGTPEPGRQGLHASASLLGALPHAQSPILCRVRLGGTIVGAGDQLAATERTIVATTDVTGPLRALTERWIERALGAAMEEPGLRDAPSHRSAAQAARERVLEAEERLRDAQWVLEEGAGRSGGVAQARALGEREGARRAVQEARAAAYAHEAAAQLVEESGVRSAARAIELVIDALVLFERDADAHDAVRARLDRELEDALREPLASVDASAAEPDDVVEPIPAPHRGEALMHAIERVLAAHTGVRGVHPLVLDDAIGAHVSLLLRCESFVIAQRAIDAIDESAELGPLEVRAIAVWGSGQREVVSRALLERSALDEAMRSSWQASMRDALAHPPLARDPDALVRAWLVREPDVTSAAWVAGDVLALRFDGSTQSAREVVGRLASHHPKVGAPRMATRAAREALEEAGVSLDDACDAAPIYTRSCGLADPSRVAVPFLPPVRALKRAPAEPILFPRPAASHWMSAVAALCEDVVGAEAWAIGGDEELAERFRRARVFPVAVSVRDVAHVQEAALRAEEDPDLARFRLGVFVITNAYVVPSLPTRWALDRRVRRAIHEGWIPRLIDRLRDRRPQPFVHPLKSERHARDMRLRWHLAQLDEVECAGWLYGKWMDGSVLGVLVQDEAVMPRIETELAALNPLVSVVQVCSPEPEPLIDAIRIGRVRKGTHWDTAELDLATLVPELAQAFAQPDVYEREWMLAAPPDPLRDAFDTSTEEPPRAPQKHVTLPSAANARCPRCQVEYWLSFSTPLGQTQCGLCGNACLIPNGVRSGPYLATSPSPRGYRCPSCQGVMHIALTDGAVHVRCPCCKTAVLPMPLEDS